MHYFLLIYFINKPLYVSSRLADHHEEDQLCINSKWYCHAEEEWNSFKLLKYMLKIVKSVKHIELGVCKYMYRVVRRHNYDEQQACSKHVEAY
jgi:hypothetical protein